MLLREDKSPPRRRELTKVRHPTFSSNVTLSSINLPNSDFAGPAQLGRAAAVRLGDGRDASGSRRFSFKPGEVEARLVEGSWVLEEVGVASGGNGTGSNLLSLSPLQFGVSSPPPSYSPAG